MPVIRLIAEEEGVRIDSFLAENSILSRSKIAKAIKDEKVLVNGTKTKASYKVAEGDDISLEYEEEKESELKPADIPIDVIYEDDDVLVVNKQKGLVVHPAPGNYDNTLVNALLYRNMSLSDINGYYRPGIVHRIDKDTSGLLVIAKNNESHSFLAQQLKDKICYRNYYAFVKGTIENNEGQINAPIGRNPKDRQKMTVTDRNAKEAITDFTVLERYGDATLVECRLETGRTHQIRVHMAYIHHPVINDSKYGKDLIDQSGQYLHAYKLSFIHPRSKERMTFQTEMPDYMKDYIAKKGGHYGLERL